MIPAADPVVVSVPRAVLTDIVALSADLTDRMHALLERNTDGELTGVELQELETMTQIAQFGQIVSTALDTNAGQ
ncbi:MAG TPA: hypothetical protein VF796_16680 [Humisphaera sp.]